MHFTIKLEGETVRDVDMSLGYNHRGVEKGFESRDFFKDIYLSERVCGLCGHSHSSCFVKGMEEIMGIRVPERAQYIRTLVFELARVHSHLLYLAMCAYEMGYDTLFQLLFRDREGVMEILEEITGNRVHYVINTFGGVRRDFSMNPGIRERLYNLKVRTVDAIEYFNSEHSIRNRTKGRGEIKHKDAVELGIVGPNARASGISTDIRRDDPYFSYGDLKFRVIQMGNGDILSRINVRLYETLESLKMVDQLLERMPKGKIKVPVTFSNIPATEHVTRVEAPRGELFYYIRTSAGKQSPDRVKIRTPTYATMNAIPALLRGLELADVSIAVMSIDPCMSCTDRVTLLDLGTGKKRVVSGEDLRNVD
ncbi:MAG: nickel-dependent hydrogenase large subunit [archaeon]|nr:MAG: nickel-dependent hydrogenase large subunit [archaeon]